MSVAENISPLKNQYIELDNAELLKKGYLAVSNDKSSFNEQFRQIKRTVINKAFGTNNQPRKSNESNLVMVTSANKGEGKTFTSINLSLSSALEKDKTVLLIDANVINPSIHKELGFNAPVGLVEFLLGDVEELRDVICNTSIPNLKIIPAGSPHHLTNELLASDRMKTLTTELSTRYPDRLVILDAPEINSISETPILADLMGQGLLVVESGKTSLYSAKQAKSSLPSALDCGIIINKQL